MAETFLNHGRLFIKSFLLDDTLNLNKWGVTKDALLNNLNSFIGKPFVLTPRFDHPDAPTGDELLITQEEFRVGNIIEVGFETSTGKAFAVSEITDSDAAAKLQQGEPMFVSPSILFGTEDAQVSPSTQTTIVTSFEGAHLAAVKDPAYGIQKAQIKGKCNGDSLTCRTQLSRVQASVEESPSPVTYAGFPTLRECVEANMDGEDDPVGYCMMKREIQNAVITDSECGKFTKIDTGNAVYITAQSDCVSNCLSKKKDEGITIDDQAIAICLSECGESKEGNIDPTSLENITTPCTLKIDGKPNVECRTSSDKESTAYKKAMTLYKKAQDEEDKEDEEESKKAQDEEDKEDEEEQGKKSAQEEDELEKIREEMARLKGQLKSLKSQVHQASITPLAEQVLEAKQKLNMVTQGESDQALQSLLALDESTLTQLKAEYDGIIKAQNTPRYTVKYASVGSEESDGKIYLDKAMEAMK